MNVLLVIMVLTIIIIATYALIAIPLLLSEIALLKLKTHQETQVAPWDKK